MYYLSSCSTCHKIIKDTKLAGKDIVLQDIKTEPLTAAQLGEMKKLAGSYEALFSRRAIKYKTLHLKDKQLTENDYRDYILQDYTFLKRPVTILGKKIFVGSEKKTVEAFTEAL